MAKLAISLFILVLAVAGTLNRARSTSNPRSIEFIHASCASTLHPTLCFASLAPYASTIGQDPLKLSEIATSLTLSRVRSLASRMSSRPTSAAVAPTSTDPATRQATAKALRDCAELLRDAADRTRDSMAELKKLNAANATESRWCVSNVQTWMSAVLTNEETCTDGLREAAGTRNPNSATDDVSGRVGVAKEYTGIALALVNKLDVN